jgi:hypothetical protein
MRWVFDVPYPLSHVYQLPLCGVRDVLLVMIPEVLPLLVYFVQPVLAPLSKPGFACRFVVVEQDPPLLTVTLTAADVAVFAAASKALVVRLWPPLETDAVFQLMLYGDVVSVPINVVEST